MMLMALIKIVVSALIVGAVTSIAKSNSTVGGWIAALPIISLLSAIWLFVGHQTNRDIAEFLVGVLKGLIPTAILLAAVVVCLKQGIRFLPSMGIGVLVWAVFSLSLQRLGI